MEFHYMDLTASRKSYARAMEILDSSFGWRTELMDEYERAIDDADGETVETLAEGLEAVHQVQHRAFDMLQVMSRHFLHILDEQNAVELFNALNETPVDIADPDIALSTIEALASRAEFTSDSSRKWLDEGLADLKDPSREEVLSLVTGGVMLLISENFHEVVNRHQDLSDRMIELLQRAKDGFPDLAVVPSDFIPILNPGENARSAERTLQEYTETYLDPDMNKAYR